MIVKQHNCHQTYKDALEEHEISHIKATYQSQQNGCFSRASWQNYKSAGLSLQDQRSPADLRLHLNKLFKQYSGAFDLFVIVSWDQSLTVSLHLICWLQLSAPLEEKHAWTSELNEHVGIQWILICLCFRKSSGKKGRKFIREKIEKGTSPAAWFPARVPRGAEKQLALRLW